MNLAEQLSALAIVISLLALAASTLLTARQARTMQNSNHLPVVTDIIRAFRQREFYDNLFYVTTRLRVEHENPAVGISGLPDDARATFLNVAFYYQACAWLIELKIVSDEPVAALMRERILITWPIIKPYVEAERAVMPGPVLQLLERVHDSSLSR